MHFTPPTPLSVKDRIGYRMVLEAEKSGRIKKGDTIIEPTSGNTGIGLALAGAVKGYRVIIVLPEKMSMEKVNVLKALGAEIVRTPTEAAWDSPDSHISVAAKLLNELPNAHILDQYANPYNPIAHYDDTAEEILEQTDGKVDMLVAGAGTGGTITGIAKKLKERLPDVQIVGVDPYGSILAQPESLNETDVTGYQVEGIGYDFIPKVLERKYIDRWVKADDKASLNHARELIRLEGLLCGGSSGCAILGAIEAARDLREDQRCVVILPDSIRNYMTKHLDPEWMVDLGYMDASEAFGEERGWWANKQVRDLHLTVPITVSDDVTIAECSKILHTNGFDQVPVTNDNGDVVGVVTEGNLSAKLLRGAVTPEDPVTKVLFHKYRSVQANTSLAELGQAFNRDYFALVVCTQKNYCAAGKLTERTTVNGLVTRIDLLDFIMKGE
jgi:cystathionine beta-synthase